MNTNRPCWKSDDWTRESNKYTPTNSKDQAQMEADADAGLRSQITCMTCPMRSKCLSKALNTPYDEDYYIWGGYTRGERQRLREGTFKWHLLDREPSRKTRARIAAFMAGASSRELAEKEGTDNLWSILSTIRDHLWRLRRDAGDNRVLGQFAGNAQSVPAA